MQIPWFIIENERYSNDCCRYGGSLRLNATAHTLSISTIAHMTAHTQNNRQFFSSRVSKFGKTKYFRVQTFWYYYLCVINLIAHLKCLKWLGVHVQIETGVVNHEQNDLRFKLFLFCFLSFATITLYYLRICLKLCALLS